MSSETAWKARFSRLMSGAATPRDVRLSAAHLRVLVALEAYRQVRLPGLPGPAAMNRVAKVDEATFRRALDTLSAHGLLPEGA
jgi:hypothetical protein